MTFKLFDGFGRSAGYEASLRRHGRLFLTSGLLKEIGDGVDSVIVHIDEEKKMVGLTKGPKCKASRRLNYEKNGGANIDIAAVLRRLGIESPAKRVHLVSQIEGGMIIFDLSKLPPSFGASISEKASKRR